MRLCFLLERGSPPRLNPILADTVARLEACGARVTLRYPEEELIRLDTLTIEADLYLLKSDTELALSLATALEGLGAMVLNPSSACMLAKDKILATATLLLAGILSPHSLAAAEPATLASAVVAEPLILKPHRGYNGVGITVAETPEALLGEVIYPDLVFAQRYLTHARRDLKVFGIGQEVFGVRNIFAADGVLQGGKAARLSPELEDTARRCGRAFGLELYGLDIAEEEDGPYVIDVNYFPGYRGVPDAARPLAEYILRAAKG